MNVMAMARAERADLADFLETLSPQQWDAPSLCSDWSVRDVVAHVISYEDHGNADLAKRLVKTRFRPHLLNEVALAEYSDRSPEALLEPAGARRPANSTARARHGGVGMTPARAR